MPPSPADTRFITNIPKAVVVSLGVHQLALRSFGPIDLLPCALEEKIPNAHKDNDDIVCLGMDFGRSLGHEHNNVNANRTIAVWKSNGKPVRSTRAMRSGRESPSSSARGSQTGPQKRRRVGM
ncbi:hypothetical protein K523DRAFT_358688 [Schizophyllum commune Tattone D]|nr:hypothetical protein K523DRAFT_358688 [Schizophyllum commune Tattone D]